MSVQDTTIGKLDQSSVEGGSNLLIAFERRIDGNNTPMFKLVQTSPGGLTTDKVFDTKTELVEAFKREVATA